MRKLSFVFAIVFAPALAVAQDKPAPAAQPAPATPAPAADDTADSLVVYAGHSEPKPIDPVGVRFEKITVKSAKFDPKKIVGGTAELEIDVNSLKTDSAKRDAHLKSADYTNAEKFSTVNVKIANVKKGDKENSYKADATVKFMGATYKWPVTFEVLETTADGVRVRGEHKFTRKDLKIGKAEGDPVAQDLRAVLTLNLKPTK
jgi:polyisoprenoid-binding protein YceI